MLTLPLINQHSKYNNPCFSAIRLSGKEKYSAVDLLKKITTADKSLNLETLKYNIFAIFEKHIISEAKEKASSLYIFEDVLQEMYLKFFEVLNIIKNADLQTIIESIEGYKPGKNEIKEQYSHNISIDAPSYEGYESSITRTLTNDSLPVYLSSASEEERSAYRAELKKIIEKSEISEQEKEFLYYTSEGLSSRKIARMINRPSALIRRRVKIAKLKLQNENNVLPNEYRDYAIYIKEKYKLSEKIDDLIEAVIQFNPYLSISPDRLDNWLRKSAKLLLLDFNKFTPVVFKHVHILSSTPETLYKNVSEASKILGMKYEDYTKAVMQNPELLKYKSETIEAKINELSELFHKSPVFIKKLVSRKVNILTLKPQTIYNNMVDLADMLGVEQERWFSIALTNYSIITAKPKTFYNYAKKAAENLNMPFDDFIKLGMKYSPLFSTSPKTMRSNVNRTSKLLRLEEEKIYKLAKYYPAILCSRPERIYNNVLGLSNKLNINFDKMVEISLRVIFLFAKAPDSIINNVTRLSELLGLSFDEVAQYAVTNPMILTANPEVAVKKIKIYSYFLQVIGKNTEKLYSYRNNSESCLYSKILAHYIFTQDKYRKKDRVTDKILADYIVNKAKPSYEFEIPDNELAEEFIKFAEDMSINLLGKNIFKIKIAHQN